MLLLIARRSHILNCRRNAFVWPPSQCLSNTLGPSWKGGKQFTANAIRTNHFSTARHPQRHSSITLLAAGTGLCTLVLLRHGSDDKDDSITSALSSPACIPSSRERRFIPSPNERSFSLVDLLKEHIWEPIRTTARFLHLVLLFVPVLITSPLLCIGKDDPKFQGEKWGAVWWYEFLVAQMERAGPTFIKLAQWAGSRADLFPALLCDRLGALHSNGAPHSFGHTRRLVEKIFQKPFQDVFEDFDEVPIGVGAIAQVYRATLKHDLLPVSYQDPKRPQPSLTDAPSFSYDPPPSTPTASVAIKILHPNVGKTISRDLTILSIFANLLTLIPGVEWLSLSEEVDVFGRMMNEQLDLRHEARNLRTFEKNFTARRAAVSFPRPLEQWSSPEMLIEEFETALPLKYFMQNYGGPYDDKIAELGLDAYLNMLLLDNFVHADLHPGNIMIKFYKPSTRFVLKGILASVLGTEPPPSDDASQSIASDALIARMRTLADDRNAWCQELKDLESQGYEPELVFIDTGLVTTLDDANRQNFLELFKAVASFDGYTAGQLMVERCRAPTLALDPDIFALKMQHIVLNVKRKTFSLAHIKIADILTDVLRAVRTHHVKMEADFVNTVLSILLLEGIGRQLDPRLDLFKNALPMLRKLGRQMTTQQQVVDLPQGTNLGAMLKLWVWLEARELANTTFVNADDLIRYDWLTPGL